MSGATQSAVRILTALLLCALTPQLLRAQVSPFIDPDLSLSALTPPHAGTTIVSSAKAVLRDASNGGQRLSSQIIMGHSVADLNTQAEIYQKRVVSEIGDASNQATMSGVLFHCYEAGMSVHVNAYNLHPIYASPQVCPEPFEPPPRPEVPKENCPVLLDLQQDGFHLSGPDPAVRFDIDADGIQDEIAWTEAGGDDAFSVGTETTTASSTTGASSLAMRLPCCPAVRRKSATERSPSSISLSVEATATGRSMPMTRSFQSFAPGLMATEMA